jgi:flagellar hook protein FlgE
MRIETALYTSREGIAAHGGAISAIGDNISNVNTTGFKSQRVEFANLVADGISGGNTTQTEGTGNGVRIATVRQIHTNGTIEPTGRDLDVAIAGQGFFAIGNPEAPLYTRAGNFRLDANGNLQTINGEAILGFSYENGAPAAVLTPINMLDFEAASSPTTRMDLSGNLSSASDIREAPANPATFDELATQANFLSNITVIDSLGESHNVLMAFTKTAANTFTAQAYTDGIEVGGAAGAPTLLGTAQLQFDGTGQLVEGTEETAQILINPAWANGANAGEITLNLAGFKQFANNSTVSNVTQDGIPTGALSKYVFTANGDIQAELDNGETITIANLAITTFTNLDGLRKLGENLYIATAEAGNPNIGIPGTDGRGDLQGSALERSTVELSNEFTNLVLYQKGYQANSKMLNMVDQMLDQALSMLR